MFRLIGLSLVLGVGLGCSGDGGSASPDASSQDAMSGDAELDAVADAASLDAEVDASADAEIDAMEDASIADASPDADPMMGCGMRPRPSCCFDPADCSAGRCIGATGCMPMGEGVCKTPDELRAGQCWDIADCEAGATCEGAVICPCMVRCIVPDVPGICTVAS